VRGSRSRWGGGEKEVLCWRGDKKRNVVWTAQRGGGKTTYWEEGGPLKRKDRLVQRGKFADAGGGEGLHGSSEGGGVGVRRGRGGQRREERGKKSGFYMKGCFSERGET